MGQTHPLAHAQDAEPARVIIAGGGYDIRKSAGLAAGMQDPDPAVRSALIRYVSRHPWEFENLEAIGDQLAPDLPREDRLAGARLLGKRRAGNDPAKQIADLVRLLEDADADIREVAVKSLVELAQRRSFDAGIGARLLQHADPQVRLGAARVVATLGQPETLLPLLDVSEEISAQALEAIRTCGKRAAKLAPDLASRLDRPERIREILPLLVQFGPLSQTTHPHLLAILPEARGSYRVSGPLGRICQANPELLTKVERLAAQPGPAQAGALVVLARAGTRSNPLPSAALAELSVGLDAPAAATRLEAVQRLGDIGQRAQPTAERVRARLADVDVAVRIAALHTLRSLGGADEAVAQEVATILTAAEDEKLREAAAACLGHLGTDLPAAERLLAAQLGHGSPAVRQAALRGYANYRWPHRQAARFAALLSDPDESVALEAGKRLQHIASFPGDLSHQSRGSLLEVLGARLRDGRLAIRQSVVKALAACWEDQRVAPTLAGALHDPDPEVRIQALQGLGRQRYEPLRHFWLVAARLGDPWLAPAARAALQGSWLSAAIEALPDLDRRRLGTELVVFLCAQGAVLPEEALDQLSAWRQLWSRDETATARLVLAAWMAQWPPAQRPLLRAQAYLWLGGAVDG